MSDTLIDLEVPLLPEAPAVREGFVVFHTLEGALYRCLKGTWERCNDLIPYGKIWFTPQHVLREWDGTGWADYGEG
jgi:hypothetical protein